jgi:dTDP-4-dehydrorhamnose 3,5-epimerase-like enzyme
MTRAAPEHADLVDVVKTQEKRAKGKGQRMHVVDTSVVNAMVIEPSPHADTRVRFMRAWCVREFAEHQMGFEPVQANLGFGTERRTIRGMHGSRTPEVNTEMHYMTSAFYTRSAVRGVRFDDPAFGIDWPSVVTEMSEQDRNWPLSEYPLRDRPTLDGLLLA